jgi:glycosyltransferase involved in cell wall biosynthesis
VAKVSVLLPVRDALPWLPAALASLGRQTLSDFEIVAVDDGSRDGSAAWLDAAAGREPRLRVIHTPPLGLPAALNRALAASAAPLVARHDADDLSHRRRLELQARAFADDGGPGPPPDVVGCRLRLFPAAAAGAGMRRWAAWHNALLTHEEMAREALIDSPLAHGTAMLRRATLEAVGGWQERGWAEDLDLWLRLLAAGARFAKLPHRLYAWRQHASSATRLDPRYDRARFLALKRAALEHGLLRGAAVTTLVGVGGSLARWHAALAADGRPVRVHEARRPTPGVVGALVPPLVLVYVARAARERWRRALLAAGLREGTEFTFVA